MREHDDYYNDENIRLYTPVLQRVIILAAVVIAVPVMMWTITTFVRGYIGRPKVPARCRVYQPARSNPGDFTVTTQSSSISGRSVGVAAYRRDFGERCGRHQKRASQSCFGAGRRRVAADREQSVRRFSAHCTDALVCNHHGNHNRGHIDR